MSELTQKCVDELSAEEFACFLTEGCVIPNKPQLNDLTEEELDHYLRSYREFDL